MYFAPGEGKRRERKRGETKRRERPGVRTKGMDGWMDGWISCIVLYVGWMNCMNREGEGETDIGNPSESHWLVEGYFLRESRCLSS
jgi:hypothetical protein